MGRCRRRLDRRRLGRSGARCQTVRYRRRCRRHTQRTRVGSNRVCRTARGLSGNAHRASKRAVPSVRLQRDTARRRKDRRRRRSPVSRHDNQRWSSPAQPLARQKISSLDSPRNGPRWSPRRHRFGSDRTIGLARARCGAPGARYRRCKRDNPTFRRDRYDIAVAGSFRASTVWAAELSHLKRLTIRRLRLVASAESVRTSVAIRRCATECALPCILRA